MPWVTTSAGVEEWMPAPHEPTAAPDLRAQIAATRAKVQIDAQLAAAAPTRPLTLAEQIAATRAKVAGGGNTATAGDLAETCTLPPTLPPPPPRPLSLAEQIAATRAKAVSASVPEETPEEARERRVRAKEAREAAERAELEAELRAEEEARRQAELESEAEVAAFLAKEAEEKAAAQAVAAAAHGAETAADLAEPDLPFKPTLAQQIAATRAKLAREECARHDAEATAAADASVVSTRSAPDVAPKLPSGFKSADELAKPLEVPQPLIASDRPQI